MLFRSYGLQLEDEGTLLFHLDRAARGLLPYTDFHTGYTPGYFWIGSNALEAVGGSATGLRTLLAIVNATSAALLYSIAAYRAPAALALLAPLAWLGFMPVFPGTFAMFNVPYPAWLATLCWLVLAASLLAWERKRSLTLIVWCGVITSIAFSIKLNAGAYAAAACVWVIVGTTRSDTLADRLSGVIGAVIVGLGVWSAFGLRVWGIDAGVHLLPLVVITVLCVSLLRGRFAQETEIGAFRALVVLTISFLPLTLAWAVPTISRLGVDGFASDVLLLGSNAAEIYWIDHPDIEVYALAVTVGTLGFAVVGRLLSHGVIPLRVAVGGVVAGLVTIAGAAAFVGVMPEGRASSVVRQLENASYWLAPIVHWGMFAMIVSRLARGVCDPRVWVLGVCSVAMYWQLYPRTDFPHILFAVPLCIPLALWLLDEVLRWWARAASSKNGYRQLVWGASAIGIVIGMIPVALAAAAPLAAWGVPVQSGTSPRLAVRVESDSSDELVGFGQAVDFLLEHTEAGEPLFAFPALGGLTFAVGLTNPVDHDYWYPQRPDHVAEQRMLATLRAEPPRFVATINTGWTFFFDAPAYFAETRSWVTENYRLVRRFDHIDILARRDVLPGEPALPGGLRATGNRETEPPAVMGLAQRAQRARKWLDTIPIGVALQGVLSSKPAAAILQLRAVRDGADLRAAAVVFSAYESENARLRREANSSARMVVGRHDAAVHRWADDLSAGDYIPYIAPLRARAERHATAPDGGIRNMSKLILSILDEAEERS